MAKVSPFKFLQEVRQEVAKVTWPSRRETTITTVLVFVFATLTNRSVPGTRLVIAGENGAMMVLAIVLVSTVYGMAAATIGPPPPAP